MMAEEVVVVAVSSDNKRKFEDLEADVSRYESTEPKAEPVNNESSNGIADEDAAPPPASSEDKIDGLPLDESEPKRPRIDDKSRAFDLNGYGDADADNGIEKDEKQSPESLVAEEDQPITKDNEESLVAEDDQPMPKVIEENVGIQPSEEGQEPVDTEKNSVEKSELEKSEEPPKTLVEVESIQQDASIAEENPKQMADKMTRRIEVPNNKVGVLIGKAGDTIRYLQINSGARIQITRDAEADHCAPTRSVELLGSVESMDKAEKLINAVIAEADAGGSPSLVARGLSSAEGFVDSEQIQMQVPNEKVGLIIGKGGETIRSMQTRSGARIQLIPQNPPERDYSKERTVQITGGKRQIEMAKEFIKEAMSQPVRPSPLSGNFSLQGFRPRGYAGPTQWGQRGYAPSTGYDYQHRGPYPPHNPHYQHPPYGSYHQQMPPRSNIGSGWEQRHPSHMPGQHSHGGTYDYYGAQGGHDGPASAQFPNATTQIPGPSPVPPMGQSSHQTGYDYGHPQGHDYGHQPPYSQPAVPQQGYSHGYDENRAASQHQYGGQSNSQPAYPQIGGQPGYGTQQQYGKPPAYGYPPQGQPPQPYGAAGGGGQPGEVAYQGAAPAQSYGMPATQQQYPYANTGPAQPTYPYGTAPATDGYNQQPPASGPYAQSGQGGYVQPSAQQGPAYGHATVAHVPYPTSQGYTEQAAANNAAYGYQAPQEAGYGGAPAAVYAVPAVGQTGYAQPTPAAQAGYEPPATQPGGYGAVPTAAVPASYGKTVSPQPQPQPASQPAYPQYDSAQVYAAPR